MSNLSTQQINVSFPGLLQVPGGVTAALKTVQDGNGNPTGLQISSTGANVTTSDIFVPSVGGTQITGAVPRLISDGFGDYVSVKDFGAVGDGITDDAAAIQLALDSSAAVYLPSATYYLASGITVPEGTILWSEGCAPSNPPSGTVLLFALSVATCITMGGSSANNQSCSIKGFSINRAAGVVPSGSIGVLNQNTYASFIENIGVFRQTIALKFLGDAATKGIACMVSKVYTGTISDSHVVQDTFPEIRFEQCRFGMNGGGDVACNSYIRVQGGSTTNPANGPNSFVAVNCQFNQGGGAAVASFLNFANKTVGSISDTTLWQFVGCYIENVSTSIVSSDSTWNSLTRLIISGCMINAPTSGFWGLNAATQINESVISSNVIFSLFTLAPTLQINYLVVSDNMFGNNVSVTGVANSVVNFGNNVYRQNLSIGGTFTSGQGNFSGGNVVNTFTYTGTGANINLSPINYSVLFTPNVAFGGGSTGVTYVSRAANYSIVNNVVTIRMSINMSSKGSDTGVVSITNLPYSPSLSYTSQGAILPTGYNFTGLTSTPSAYFSAGVLYLGHYSSTGLVQLTDANFNNNTQFNLTISYFLQ
jgi:hypothetical protein